MLKLREGEKTDRHRQEDRSSERKFRVYLRPHECDNKTKKETKEEMKKNRKANRNDLLKASFYGPQE